MKNYFKVLELTPEAEFAEIKKSYFQLVRKYPPDQESAKFQEIREAYDYLQKEDNREEYKRIYRIPSPFCEVYQCALGYEKNRDYRSAIAACREGLSVEPAQEDLNKYLAQLYMKNGETGKAVKQLEIMASKAPDNLTFAGMLAIAYNERGWNKKADLQFEKVYQLGERSQEFLLSFAKNSLKQDYYKNARKLLLEIIQKEYSTGWTGTSNIAEAFSSLFTSHLEYEPSNFATDYELYEAFLQDYKGNAKKRKDVMFGVLAAIIDIYDPKLHEVKILEVMVEQISKENERSFTQENMHFFRLANFLIEESKILKDDRLGKEIQDAVKVYFDNSLMTKGEQEFFKKDIELSVLEIKLTILDAWPRIRKQISIVKSEYPLLGQEMKEFIDELEKCNSAAFLWNKYKKMYCKKAGFPSSADLKKNSKYDEKAFEESDQEENFSYYQEPFRREEPKIGRNDPCPCGSGKKYKKCCGR